MELLVLGYLIKKMEVVLLLELESIQYAYDCKYLKFNIKF
jgi:hypothetical protein